MADHKIPGEFKYNGVTYFLRVPQTINLDCLDSWEVQSTDVVVAAYPKSGMTWTCFLLKEILKQEITPGKPQCNGFPFLEFRWLGSMPAVFEADMDEYEHPRAFRTHLRYEFLAKKVEKENLKVIVVLRNPKDALVSFYHMYQQNGMGSFAGTFDDFFEMFKENRLLFGDIIEWNAEWWLHRHHPSVKVITYEGDLKQDCAKTTRELAEFVGKTLPEEEIAAITAKSSFSQMKRGKLFEGGPKGEAKPVEEKKFFRKGVIGDWKNYFSEEQSEYVEELMRCHFHPIGLKFEEN